MKRFHIKYKKCSKTGCWLWVGAINSGGYGSFKLDGKIQSSHRVSFGIFKGEIPEGKWVLHHCDVRNCVNPDHLYLGDRNQNVADMWNRQRNPDRDGENHPKCKLSDEEVIEIRLKYIPRIVTQKSLAEEYGVTQGLITKIVNNKIWDHVNA